MYNLKMNYLGLIFLLNRLILTYRTTAIQAKKFREEELFL